MIGKLYVAPRQIEYEVTGVADEKLDAQLKAHSWFRGCLQRDGKNYILIDDTDLVTVPAEALAIAAPLEQLT